VSGGEQGLRQAFDVKSDVKYHVKSVVKYDVKI
jgi:hypothetical protein